MIPPKILLNSDSKFRTERLCGGVFLFSWMLKIQKPESYDPGFCGPLREKILLRATRANDGIVPNEEKLSNGESCRSRGSLAYESR